MTHANKKLTKALQQLNEQKPKSSNPAPLQAFDPRCMVLSPEIDRFIQERQEYMDETRAVSTGTY